MICHLAKNYFFLEFILVKKIDNNSPDFLSGIGGILINNTVFLNCF
jgi:hypothetical protein